MQLLITLAVLPAYVVGWTFGILYRVGETGYLQGYVWAENYEIRRILTKQGFSKKEVDQYIQGLSQVGPTDAELEEIDEELNKDKE